MPPRHLTPALVACHCRLPPLRVVAPSAEFLGARRSCGQLLIVVINLLVYYGHPPPGCRFGHAIFNGGHVIRQKLKQQQ
jgi:hypothetical protein